MRAKDIYRKLTLAHFRERKFHHALSESWASLSEVLEQCGKNSAAEQALIESLAVAEVLTDLWPGILKYEEDVVFRTLCLCQLRKSMNQMAKAEALWDRGLPRLKSVVKQLLASVPGLTQRQKWLCAFARRIKL